MFIWPSGAVFESLIAARRHPAHRFFASTRRRRAKKNAYKNGDEYKKKP